MYGCVCASTSGLTRSDTGARAPAAAGGRARGGELGGGFDVEAANARAQPRLHLGGCLAHAGKDDVGRIAAGGDDVGELAAGDDVEAAAEAGEQVEHGEVGVRLHRGTHKMREPANGAANA